MLRERYADLHACPHCGAHRWQQAIEQWAQDTVSCGECLHEYRRQDLEAVTVGLD